MPNKKGSRADRKLQSRFSRTVNPMSRTTRPPEADLVFSRSSLFAARSQRLLQALLGPQPSKDTDNAKTTEQLEEEEAEVFKPESDVYVDLQTAYLKFCSPCQDRSWF